LFPGTIRANNNRRIRESNNTLGKQVSATIADRDNGTIKLGSTSIREAIKFHLYGLREDGPPIPPASSRVDYVEIAA
jgi:hypothetical protein